MPRPRRLQRLTVFLLKEELARENALREPSTVVSHVVPSVDAAPSLFVASTAPHAPSWQHFLDPHVAGSLSGLYAASSGAILLIQASQRLFAVIFGQGRHLLNAEAFEHDFGLKVVLNTVEPNHLKSVDSKTIDETTMHTRRDLSRDSTLAAFGLDVSRDLLRAVTGTPHDDSFGPRLTGSDALGLQTRLEVPELAEFFSRLLEAYQAETYIASGFDFIDFLRPEKRVSRLRELEAQLMDALAESRIADVHLAAPEPIDWLDIE
jgi:uncharacterized protein (TIGR04141 family)